MPRKYTKRFTLEQRFWAKVQKSDNPADCWLWIGGRDPNGYGRININHRAVLAHRVAYELANGPFFKVCDVCHRCDNPPCVNPAHLCLGAHADNMRDARERGRMARGKNNGTVRHPERHKRGTQVRTGVFGSTSLRSGGIMPLACYVPVLPAMLP
jgi:hypothetical protein